MSIKTTQLGLASFFVVVVFCGEGHKGREADIEGLRSEYDHGVFPDTP